MLSTADSYYNTNVTNDCYKLVNVNNTNWKYSNIEIKYEFYNKDNNVREKMQMLLVLTEVIG